ncbi:type VI secretion system-associated FHA domain protein TagH [Piscirickettsia litoralis]|nr:type VI secretion system-associated FHA domain protein TagH [Piscirickettsia litoralis]
MRVTKSPESEIGFSHYKEFSGQGGVVGRSERCDWWLPDRSNIISNQHMFIRYQDSQFYVVDNSTNGTSLGNEEKDALIPGKPYLLAEGNEIAIGEYIISIEKIINNEEKLESKPDSSVSSNLEGELPFLNPHAETDLERLIQNEQTATPRQPNTQILEDKFNAWANPVPPLQPKPETQPPQPSRFAPFEAATLGQPQESGQAVQEAVRPQPQFNRFSQEPAKTPIEPKPFTGFQPQEPVRQQATRQPSPAQNNTKAAESKVTAMPIQNSADQSNFLNALIQRFGLSQDALYALGEEQVINIMADLLEGTLEGFIELLIARAKIKNDLNVDMTMIQSEENNILKHSVHAKQAISLFLQPQSDSFLAAKPAIKDAVKDIKQHQRALFEAVRKALHSTLNSVDPLTIERQVSESKRYFFPGKKLQGRLLERLQ